MLWLFVCFNKSHHITWELCVEYITTGVGLETPQVWAWRPPRCGPGDPPGVGLETPWVWVLRPPPGQTPQLPPMDMGLEIPPWPDPSTSPHGVDLETPLETCKACWDTTTPHPLGDLLQGMLGFHPPPVDRQTRVKTLPSQTSFAGGNKKIKCYQNC